MTQKSIISKIVGLFSIPFFLLGAIGLGLTYKAVDKPPFDYGKVLLYLAISLFFLGVGGLMKTASQLISGDYSSSSFAAAVVRLTNRIKDPAGAKLRKTRANSIKKIKDTKDVGSLIAALKDSDEDIRGTAAKVLGNTKDSLSLIPLINALQDPSAFVRHSAAEALGKVPDARSVEPLILALQDESWSVRYQVAITLGGIGDARAVESLITALQDKESIVRSGAVQGLSKIKDVRVFDALINELNSEDSRVRLKAVEALGNLGDGRAVDYLIPVLKDDEEWAVRGQALEALRKITGQAIGSDEEKWLKWWRKNKAELENVRNDL